MLDAVPVASEVVYRGNNAASRELKISGLVDLISRLKTWLRYELFNIHPVQECRVLDTSNPTVRGEGIVYHSLNEITRTKNQDIWSAPKSIEGN